MNILILIIGLWDYSYKIAVEAVYDNNVFSYSQEYIDEFIHQVRPYRFPFETYDDLRTTASLNLLIRNRFFGQRTTTFNINTTLNHHLINKEKDFQKINIGIRQSLGDIAFKINYRIIPHFLIRYYQNPISADPDYIGCSTQYHAISGKLSFYPWESSDIFIKYTYGRDNYIDEFNLYDAQNHRLATYGIWHVSNHTQIEAGYELKISHLDSSTSTLASEPNIPDRAYTQHEIGGYLQKHGKIIFPATITIGYRYGFRNYASDQPADAIHYGRQDHTHRIFFGSEFRLLTGMLVPVTYIRQWRNATSEILVDIGRIKSYDKYRLSAGLKFYY